VNRYDTTCSDPLFLLIAADVRCSTTSVLRIGVDDPHANNVEQHVMSYPVRKQKQRAVKPWWREQEGVRC
jgi:hypothetical protein